MANYNLYKDTETVTIPALIEETERSESVVCGKIKEDEAMTNLNETIRTTADRIFCGLEAALTEGATAEEKARINGLLHEGFDPADSYTSVYIVPFLQDIAKDCGMTAETFEVDEEAVIDHFADDIRDLLEEKALCDWLDNSFGDYSAIPFLRLTQDAYPINDRFGGVVYEAHAVDQGGEEYMVRWDLLPDFNPEEDPEDHSCDWDNPSEVVDEYNRPVHDFVLNR